MSPTPVGGRLRCSLKELWIEDQLEFIRLKCVSIRVRCVGWRPGRGQRSQRALPKTTQFGRCRPIGSLPPVGSLPARRNRTVRGKVWQPPRVLFSRWDHDLSRGLLGSAARVAASEVLSLRWRDVDWDGGRINVQSPKTEHHPGKASRIIPLFPELRPILAESFELAPDGAEFVVDGKFRKAARGPGGWLNTNLRTNFEKIVRCAGLQKWPRLFHNLRASRETELVESYPVQVVTSWLGNTPSVAMRHYLMTTSKPR